MESKWIDATKHQSNQRCCAGNDVMTDVALDPYSSYGHDGIVEEWRNCK